MFTLNRKAKQSKWPISTEHVTLSLWPGAAPGPASNSAPEVDTTKPTDTLVAGRPVVRLGNISMPTLTLFRPQVKSTGAAIVVFPGGAYRILASDLEGTEVCARLNEAGVTCAMLKYRVPDTGPYPESAQALQDAQRALGIVRLHAAEWQIDPRRIGVLGFSAGAHLATCLGTHFDKRLYDPVDEADALNCRPDFSVLIYPAYLVESGPDFALKAELIPTSATPPAFILQTGDDPYHVENALVYYQKLKNAGVPAELHIYANGGHGFGLRESELTATTWPDSVQAWLRTIRVLPAGQ